MNSMANMPEYYIKADKVFFTFTNMAGMDHSVHDSDCEESMKINWLPRYSLHMIAESEEFSEVIKGMSEWRTPPKDEMITQSLMYYFNYILDDDEKQVFLKMQGDAFTATVERGETFDFIEDFINHVGWNRSEVKGYADKILESEDDKYEVVKHVDKLYQEMLIMFTPDMVAKYIQENFLFNERLPPAVKFWNYEQLGAINVLCTGYLYNINKDKG
jgi:hypothetical protein